MLNHISKREKLIIMLAVMSGLFLVALDQTIIATALSAITEEFDSFSSLGFIVTAYMLTSTVSVPLAGKLSDMYGRRPVLLTGVIIFTIGSLLSGAAQNIEWLIAARALQGLGGGAIMANAFTIIGDLFSPRERGRWQGIIGAVFGISSVIGPLLGGWLTDGQAIGGIVTDWRWTFYINVPVGIVAGLIIARYCPQIKHDDVHKPDYLGAVWITAALSSLVLAVDNTEAIFREVIDNGVSLSAIRIILVGLFVVTTALFIKTERKAAQPILPLRFFKSKVFTLMSISTLLFGAAFLGAILYLTQFNQQVFNATASQAGLMLLPMMAGLVMSSIVIGQIVSRTGRYKSFIITGMMIGATAVAMLTLLHAGSPYWHEALIMFGVGVGLGMVMPILNLAVQNEFEQKDLGAATSSVQLFRGLGSTIGTAALNGVLTAGIMSSIGTASDIPYIQTLKQSPETSQVLGDDASADTLLAINTQEDEIAKNAEKSLMSSGQTRDVVSSQLKQFELEQDDFHTKIIDAFTDSLHNVFWISSSLMVLALLVSVALPNKKLREHGSDSPGIVH